MWKFIAVLAVLCALLILAQWYVFLSVRTYLFLREAPVTRRVAYPVLAGIGFGSYLCSQLIFDSELLPQGSLAQKAVAVGFFAYLACVLLLCGFFSLLRLAEAVLLVKDRVWAAVSRRPAYQQTAGPGLSVDGHQGFSDTDITMAAACPSCQEDRGCRPGDDSDRVNMHGERQAAYASTYPPARGSRRNFLKWSAVTGLTSVMALSGHAVAKAYQSPTLHEFDVVHPLLAGLREDFTAIHITDFHFGLFFGAEELESLVQRVNGIDADILFVTGDVFHSPFSPAEMAPPILRQLRPRRLGNYAVLGNHDFYAGEQRSVKCIEKSGLILLRNQWITFKEGSTEIHVGGMDDPKVNWLWGAQFPNFPAVMAGAPDRNGFRILLSHRPSVLPLAARAGINLILSGHIHGGQIILPYPGADRGVSVARIVSPYTHGWYSEGRCRMYLNRGVGLTFVPLRINCPSEIAVFRLKPGQDDGNRAVDKTA